MKESVRFEAHAVILAGGRGTRFWPRSRTKTPKQLLNIVGERTMLEQTVERLAPVFPMSRTWVVTNAEQGAAVRRQLPRLPRAHLLTEPIGRNTAAAIGLAAVHLKREHGEDVVMAVLPADHYIARPERYRRIVRAALEVAARGPHLVVMGIPPARPETGYGYIECSKPMRSVRAAGFGDARGQRIYEVRRFTEKPALALARRYVAAGRYFWNAGMFFWRVATFLDALKKFLPATHSALLRLARDAGTPRYSRSLRRIYPRLENISVDYAVMEPATRSRPSRSAHGARSSSPRGKVFVLPAEVGWSDIGSWAAVYELLAGKSGENIFAGAHVALDARGNYVWSPRKLAALVGVHNLVVVDTADALLICPRHRSQDVGRVVRWLETNRRTGLL